ncbi:phage-like protein [Acinetobacter nosocomialis]|uniref:phage-like protein n=1 Tax=Acinetobacter nosocomialis TaxID=106654 RepID=UPI00057DB7E4|nr:phage-like protein [Acinetobacter nosocomialis]AJB47244.1 phage-like protein [Acinetobacter nosocomialis]
MKEQCKQAVAKALGKQSLTAQEAIKIESRINEAMRNMARKDIDKWRNLSDSEKLTEASKQVAIDIQEQLKRKHKIAANDILTQSKNLAKLDHSRLSASEVVDRMVAAHGDMSGIQSIDSKARGIASIYEGFLTDFYTNIKGGLGIFTDQELVQKIVRERFGENTGDALAKKISDKMGDVFETMRDRFNRNGGDIGKLDNWGLPQTHNLEKIAQAGKQAWVTKAESLVDTRQYVHENGDYYSQQEIRSLLEYTYDTLSSDGANKIEVGRQPTGGGDSKVTNRHGESRVLHFKDAESWLEYQSEFGGMRFVDLVEAHIKGLSKDIALVENLGSNPKTAFKILKNAADKKDREAKRIMTEDNPVLNRAQVMFDEFSGGNSPESQVLANLGIAYRSMNIFSLLGGTTIASTTDQATIAKTAHVHGLSYRKAFGELIGQLNPANKADRELAHSLGLATEEMLGSIARWSDDGLTSTYSKSEKLARISSGVATQVMRVSFLNALTSASKVGFTKLLMEKYGRLSRSKAWNDLDVQDRELLSNTGLDERAWQVFQLADPVVDRKGNQLMSARSIYEIPDEKLTSFGDPKQIKDQVASQLQAHLLDEQGMAVIEAGLREKTLINVGARGTKTGEIFRGITQFKSFSVAFLMRHGSRTMAQEGLKGKAAYAIPLFVMTTLLGGLVVQLKELLNGNDPQTMWDSDDPKKASSFFVRSAVQGGGLSFLGDILVAGTDTSGRDANSFVAGPLGSDFTALLGLTVGNLTQYNEGKDTNFGNEAFRFVKGKVPAQNLWYTKAAINRMVFDEMQDTIAPGYREKALRKAERQQDRERFWGDDISDIRAPDFERVVQ